MLNIVSKSPVGSEEWSDKLRRKAKDLSNRINRDYMDLGEILYTVWDTPIDGNPQKPPVYTAWGYTTFSDYAEQELGLHRRNAEHLRRIYYVLEKELKGLNPILRRKFVGLGRSKARELVRVLTMQNAEEWITMAERVSYKELLATIKQSLEETDVEESVKGPSETPKPIESAKKRTFLLYPEQDSNVNLAISRAQEMSNSEKIGHNLDLICTDFLATNDFLKSNDVKMWKRFFAKYESILKLDIVVLNPRTQQVFYGAEKLRSFVEDMSDD